MQPKEYLDQYVFYGLTNLNDGFDSPGIKYFSEAEFEIVLNRVKLLGLGIYGIEPWLNGNFYDVSSPENGHTKYTDSSWYMQAFENFKKQNLNLQYSASYYIPKKYFK